MIEKLNYAVQQARKSKFYHTKLKTSTPITSLEQFCSLPLTTAEDLAENSPLFLTGSQIETAKIVTAQTSGTSLKRKRIFFSEDDLKSIITFFSNGLSSIIKKGQKTMVMMPCYPTNALGDLICSAVEELEASPIPIGFLNRFEAAYEALLTANSIVGTPLQILALARYSSQLKKKPLFLQGILLSADYGNPEVYQEIENTFHCPVINHYGSTEMGYGGAVQCLKKDGLHIRTKDLFFEVIDENSKTHLPDGSWGELVVTTLSRTLMPLIRYRTGDYGKILKDSCACGSRGACLAPIKGRISERSREHTEIPSLYQLDHIMFSLPTLIDYTAAIEKTAICITLYVFECHTSGDSTILETKLKQEFPSLSFVISLVKRNQWPNLYKGKRSYSQTSYLI